MSETAADENPIAETTEENEASLEKNDDELKIEYGTKSIVKDLLENPNATNANQVNKNAEESDKVAVATSSCFQDANKASANETDAVTKEIVPTLELPEATKIAQVNVENQRNSDSDANTRNEPVDDAAVDVHNTTTANNLTSKDNSPAETINTTTSTSLTTNSTSDTKTTTSSVKTTTDASDEYTEHITYTDDGNAIYTDPKTCHKYKWCAKENNWLYWMSGGDKLPTDTSSTTTSTSSDNPYENEHYKWCSERNQWMPKAQKTEALAGTQTETEHYKWDAAKHAWIPKVQNQQTTSVTPTSDGVTYGIDENGQRIYTDKDGVVFFWDAEKSAWFPRIDDDFMARYQMSYGFIDNTSASEAERKLKEEAEEKRKELELQQMAAEARAATEATAAGVGGAAAAAKRKAVQEPPTWFELNPEQNTKVYVSNLPLDITLDEFNEVMSKCGMIMRDPQTQKHKLKLYSEADGQLKGDGLCDYIKVESVNLALEILDEYEVRGHKIRVQRAKFQMRGEYNPALKPKRKKKDKEKLLKMKEKLFDWRPEKMRGERSKNEKVVILKNLFTPELFEKEVQLILDYTNDLREECSKCGTVRKVVIYDLHPEGVAQVNMSSPEEADLVIQMMQGRYFGMRQLTAEHWDGKTKYKMAESEVAVKSRLNHWDEFLETDEDKKPDSGTATTPPVKAAEIDAEKQLEEQYFD